MFWWPQFGESLRKNWTKSEGIIALMSTAVHTGYSRRVPLEEIKRLLGIPLEGFRKFGAVVAYVVHQIGNRAVLEVV